MQEDTPPSFLSLALRLGTPAEQPLPLDTGGAGGGGCVLARGCEPYCYLFPCAPDACRNQALEAQVSSSPSRHPEQMPFHKQSKDRELIVQEGPLQGARSRHKQQVLLVPWMGLYVVWENVEQIMTATPFVLLSPQRVTEEEEQGTVRCSSTAGHVPLPQSGCWSTP